GNLQQDEASFSFSSELLNAANAHGARFDHCFLASTGVMAGENAMKIAMQKKHPASRVLAFDHCFAGRTMAFSQITDKPAYRSGLPTTLAVDYVPFYDSAHPEESTTRAVVELKRLLQRHPGEYAAMVMELVQGEGGFNLATARFHRTLMELLHEHDVAVLVDEVQTFARTPALFAFQHYSLDELVDIVWIGKASQVCATLYRADFKPKPGLLSQTFTASVSAVAAGRVILEELVSGGYLGPDGKISRLFTHFTSRLEAIAERCPDRLTGPYGIGAMVACTPLGGDAQRVGAFVHRLYENGVMCFVAGANPTRARFLVPVGAVDESDIDEVCSIFESTLIAM
ncbi:MAG: aminotransferase class III-fold pyridoxal phosphate-dependent enzyme, partial [Planctomycetota bacterium]